MNAMDAKKCSSLNVVSKVILLYVLRLIVKLMEELQDLLVLRKLNLLLLPRVSVRLALIKFKKKKNF